MAVGTVVVLVVLFLVLRQDGDEESAVGQTTPATTDATTMTTTAPNTTAQTTSEPTGPRHIPVAVAGGRVAGGVKTVRLRRGEQVVIVVRADVSDHVHLHGYDRTADVGPGRPAQLDFRATIAGRFEVELEERRLRILELEVRP